LSPREKVKWKKADRYASKKKRVRCGCFGKLGFANRVGAEVTFGCGRRSRKAIRREKGNRRLRTQAEIMWRGNYKEEVMKPFGKQKPRCISSIMGKGIRSAEPKARTKEASRKGRHKCSFNPLKRKVVGKGDSVIEKDLPPGTQFLQKKQEGRRGASQAQAPGEGGIQVPRPNHQKVHAQGKLLG